MKIEAVATDLDGTLLNSEHKISEYNKKVLRKVTEIGIPVIIATGRIYTSLYKYKAELDLKTPVVCYNGAMVVDGMTDEKIYDVVLDKEIVKEIVNIARTENVHLNLFHGSEWYIEQTREEVETYKNTSGLEYHLLNEDDFENKLVNKLMFVGENQKLLQIEKILNEKFGNRIYKAFSRPYFLEVLDKNVSKGVSLLEVLKRMNINKENVIAFGDAENDAEMIEGVGMGIAMANASDKLKSKAKHVADTNDNDGVGRFLNEYLKLGFDDK